MICGKVLSFNLDKSSILECCASFVVDLPSLTAVVFLKLDTKVIILPLSIAVQVLKYKYENESFKLAYIVRYISYLLNS